MRFKGGESEITSLSTKEVRTFKKKGVQGKVVQKMKDLGVIVQVGHL